MKHRELLQAAIDGKTIQLQDQADKKWTALPLAAALYDLVTYPNLVYRIAPEPIPDQVYYDVIRTKKGGVKVIGSKFDGPAPYKSLESLKKAWAQDDAAGLQKVIYVKLTIKTDTNGKETKTVEIVE